MYTAAKGGVLALVRFLLSGEASDITAAEIVADGGGTDRQHRRCVPRIACFFDERSASHNHERLEPAN
jgi:hypothetical protein